MITEFKFVDDNVVEAYANGGFVARAKTAKMLAYVMKTYGLADETKIKDGNNYPYKDGIFDEALAIYNWEVNGVA